MSRDVTEQDLRAPQFKGMKVEDLEFRDDGGIVRKDRWETALRRIASTVVGSRSQFECHEVAEAVEALVGREWCTRLDDDDDFPNPDQVVEVRLTDGSILKGVTYRRGKAPKWVWHDAQLELEPDVEAWREPL